MNNTNDFEQIEEAEKTALLKSLKKQEPLRKVAFLWLSLFTIACFLNSTLLILDPEGGTGSEGVMIFAIPFFHMFFTFIVIGAFILYSTFIKGELPGLKINQYLKEKYPDTYAKIDPTGKQCKPPKAKPIAIIATLIFFLPAVIIIFTGIAPPYFIIIIPFAIFFLLPIIGVIILAFIHLLLKVLVSPEVATKFTDRVKKTGKALRKEQQKQENEPKASSAESLIRSRENRKAWKAINSGQIDNGQDPVLVQFRANQKMNGLLLAWVIFLTPVIWVYNIALIASCYWV